MSSGLSISVAAQEAPSRAALVWQGNVLSFADLAARVDPICAAIDGWRLDPNARVALWASNRLETVLTLLAFFERGVPFVPLHPRLLAKEAERLAREADPTRILMEDDLDVLALPARDRAQTPALSSTAIDPRCLLAILFTSGTTGSPKGAMLARSAFLAAAAASAECLGWEEDDRWLLCLPLCHVGGLSIVTRCLAARRAVILHPRFEPAAVLESIVRDQATILSVVPTMLRRLLDADTEGALARLRAVLVGGGPAPSVLLDECRQRGVRVLTTYGLTEACSQVTTQRPGEPIVAGSGRPLRGAEVSILGDAGEPLKHGEIGRIHIHGPALMSGYWRSPPLEGAFDTGDLGALDEAGHLHVHARRTDLIVTGGENVYPAEIEEALESQPGVRRALVFGVADETWGEIVAAAIEPETPCDERALEAAMAQALAPFKRPRRVCFVDALPVVAGDGGAAGKLDRARGRALFGPKARPWA